MWRTLALAFLPICHRHSLFGPITAIPLDFHKSL